MKIEIREVQDTDSYILKMKTVKITEGKTVEIFMPGCYLVPQDFEISRAYDEITVTDEMKKLYIDSLKNNLIQNFIYFITSIASYVPNIINYGSCNEEFKKAYNILIECGFIEPKNPEGES